MKKIIMVLVIFISSIIFYDSYVNLSQKQYNDVINLSYKFAQENDLYQVLFFMIVMLTCHRNNIMM